MTEEELSCKLCSVSKFGRYYKISSIENGVITVSYTDDTNTPDVRGSFSIIFKDINNIQLHIPEFNGSIDSTTLRRRSRFILDLINPIGKGNETCNINLVKDCIKEYLDSISVPSKV